jgi:hypothetical protein
MVRIVSIESFVAIAAGADARSRTAALTAKGLLVLEAADSAWGRTQTEIIESFGRDRWAALVSTLERLAACARSAQSTGTGPTAP